MFKKYFLLYIFVSFNVASEINSVVSKFEFERVAIESKQFAASSFSGVDSEPLKEQTVLSAGIVNHVALDNHVEIEVSNNHLNFHVNAGESIRDTISRWLWSESVQYIAFDPALNNILSSISQSNETIKALDVAFAVENLLYESGGKLSFHPGLAKSASVHTFINPQITFSRGPTLMAAVSSLAADYGWDWDSLKNWLIADDFTYKNKHVIVTEDQDISSALIQLLDGYPVRAELDHSTKQIYIVEDGATYD